MQLVNSKNQFSGYVVVCNENVYINVATGLGFNRVFELMKSSIKRLTYKYYPMLESFEDAKQEVCLNVFEGILRYDPNKGASLSTFLNIFVTNKMNNKIRDFSLRNKTQFLTTVCLEEFGGDPLYKMELKKRTECWDPKWKNIIFRIFVLDEKISNVASDEGFTPWGLTRAIRRKLNEARKM